VTSDLGYQKIMEMDQVLSLLIRSRDVPKPAHSEPSDALDIPVSPVTPPNRRRWFF
jgi:hypothetical protein